tara:strand:- start:544 stop:1329 length:786 start_codon:yes stop_codon:yes gene_type:complete
MAKSMVAIIPDHKVYVEPFAGSGAVLFAKPRVDTEVLNDLDPDISDALKTLSRMSKSDLERLLRKDWWGNGDRYKRLHDMKSSDPIERLYRFLYLAKMSFGSIRGKGSFCKREATRDHSSYFNRRLPPAVERLKGVRVFNEDYESVCKRYDSPETFFFLDPPYAGYSALDAGAKGEAKTGEKDFNEHKFFDLLKNLKGKWFLNYGERGELPGLLKQAGYPCRIIHKNRDFRHILKKGGDQDGPKTVGHLVTSNYGAKLSEI